MSVLSVRQAAVGQRRPGASRGCHRVDRLRLSVSRDRAWAAGPATLRGLVDRPCHFPCDRRVALHRIARRDPRPPDHGRGARWSVLECAAPPIRHLDRLHTKVRGSRARLVGSSSQWTLCWRKPDSNSWSHRKRKANLLKRRYVFTGHRAATELVRGWRSDVE